MIKIACGVSLAVILLVIACGRNRAEEYVKKSEDLAKKACLCGNRECARKTLLEFKTLTMDYRDIRTSDAQKERLAVAGKDFFECNMKNGINLNDFKELEKDIKDSTH